MKRRNESGQASVVLLVAVPALLVAALLIITIAGDAMVKRSETRSAADSAALASAEAWRAYVEEAINDADGMLPDDALDRLRPILAASASGLNSSEVAHRARQLAAANNAQVIGRSVSRDSRGLTFAVTTRNHDAVNQSTIKGEANATAAVRLTGGACWLGSRLGLVHDGGCMSWSQLKELWEPDDDDADSDDSDDDDSDNSDPTPVSLAPLQAEVRLVE